MTGACSGDMSAQSLKHSTESTPDDSKRLRRRSAKGRAPRSSSDSDCSDDTALLSPSPPPRSGKTRSRGCGSQWEVLESLKDGERFEQRPELFKGYLHKKRKWPLKGWHKRFFVLTGGILVYARSPTDVARCRLHGSLDVGLSVVSAKPRRRRIDIDADHLVYHLRAKTSEVYRTWLDVLKAHRLYRQDLLTYGAREYVIKIHAPLNTPSHVSRSSVERFSTLTTNPSNPSPKVKESPTFHIPSRNVSSVYEKNSQKNLQDWDVKISSGLLPLKLEPIEVENVSINLVNTNNYKPGSLCSMCCVENRIQNTDTFKQDAKTIDINAEEKVVHCTNLDLSVDPNFQSSLLESLKSTDTYNQSILLGKCSLNTSKDSKTSPINVKLSKNPLLSLQTYYKEKKPLFLGDQSQTAMYLFTHKNHNNEPVGEESWIMKKSNKSTNLVKYRNCIAEPLLKRPFSKCMLLKYKVNSGNLGINKKKDTICDIMPHGDSIDKGIKENKSIQDTITSSEYDKITEKLIFTMFANPNKERTLDSNVKRNVNQIVKELYGASPSQRDNQPVKYLFKALLDYWLINTRNESFKHTFRESKALRKQSKARFTEDKQLSSELIQTSTRATQVFAKSINVVKTENKMVSAKISRKNIKIDKETIQEVQTPKGDTDSFEKERCIQELERLLKNTVYMCEAIHSSNSKEKDIKITKTLIDNLEKSPKISVLQKVSDDKRTISDSSTELPKIQETINRLISETNLPPEVAKEFLNVYLDVLLNDNSKSNTSTSQSSDTSKVYKNIGDGPPIGDVQAESVQKKVSRSVTATPLDRTDKPSFDGDDHSKNQSLDPGQLYLKDMLDKITCIFSKNSTVGSKFEQNVMEPKLDFSERSQVKNNLEKRTNSYSTKNLIYENRHDNSVVINLSKFDLEQIAMVTDGAPADVVSLMIKLKERRSDSAEPKRRNLSLKFSNDNPKPTHKPTGFQPLPKQIATTAPKQATSRFNSFINMQNSYIDFNPTFPTDKLELRPFLSTTDATSKANCQLFHESDHSLDSSFQHSDIHLLYSPSKRSIKDDAQCYLLSSFKKAVPDEAILEKRKMRLKEKNGVLKSRVFPLEKTQKSPNGLHMCEKRPPKIIDEKFILLLLENLTLLSKNVPAIYKDINGLYLKLKKRHERTIKNSSLSPGLSLLGKIYDGCEQNPPRPMFDAETQFDATIFPISGHDCLNDAVQIAVNTSFFSPNITNVVDKSLSTRELAKTLANFEVQTESPFKTKQVNDKPSQLGTFKEKCIETQESLACKWENKNDGSILNTEISKETQTSYPSLLCDEVETLEATDRSISIQNWYKKLTQECSMSAVVKCLLDKDALTQNFRIAPPETNVTITNRDESITPKRSQRKQSAKVRQDLIKEIKLLSPSFKISMQSQTDRNFMKFVSHPERDYKVYQLFPKNKCQVTRSESDSSVATEFRERSDDLKTIYRCTSDPSFCSGLISPSAPQIRGPQVGYVSGSPGGRLASWIIDFTEIDDALSAIMKNCKPSDVPSESTSYEYSDKPL